MLGLHIPSLAMKQHETACNKSQQHVTVVTILIVLLRDGLSAWESVEILARGGESCPFKVAGQTITQKSWKAVRTQRHDTTRVAFQASAKHRWSMLANCPCSWWPKQLSTAERVCKHLQTVSSQAKTSSQTTKSRSLAAFVPSNSWKDSTKEIKRIGDIRSLDIWMIFMVFSHSSRSPTFPALPV